MKKKLFSSLFKREKPVAKMCTGCEQAMHRIQQGESATYCPMCGCTWLSKAAEREFNANQSPIRQPRSQAEFDAKFYAGVKPFRESAEKAGCDMAAFDMEIAVRKARVDQFLADARDYYQRH